MDRGERKMELTFDTDTETYPLQYCESLDHTVSICKLVAVDPVHFQKYFTLFLLVNREVVPKVYKMAFSNLRARANEMREDEL